MFDLDESDRVEAAREPFWDESRQPSAGELARLVALDPEGLDELGRVEMLRGIEAHVRWLEAVRAEVMVRVAGPVAAGDDAGREEVAVALQISPAGASTRLATARALRARLPGAAELLRQGRISFYHATVLHEATADLDEQTAGRVEREVLERAGRQTPGQLRSAARRLAARLAPLAAAERCIRAAESRRVTFWPGEAGMTTMTAELPHADAATVRAALEGLVAADHRDLPIDAKRADALTEMAAQVSTRDDLPRRHGRPVQVQLVVDLPTLLGMAEQPGEIPGFGPIPAPAARKLAADATWRRLVTEPVTGHLLDYGRTTYTPPQRLLDYVIARDGTCTFPGCCQPAYSCDADHTVPYDKGGTTSARSLRMLCRRHHRLKTLHGWFPVRNPDGSITWTSPAGAVYDTGPPPVLV